MSLVLAAGDDVEAGVESLKVGWGRAWFLTAKTLQSPLYKR